MQSINIIFQSIKCDNEKKDKSSGLRDSRCRSSHNYIGMYCHVLSLRYLIHNYIGKISTSDQRTIKQNRSLIKRILPRQSVTCLRFEHVNVHRM